MKSIGLLLILLGLIFGGVYVYQLHQDETRAGLTANSPDYDQDGMPIRHDGEPAANAEDRDRYEQYELLAGVVCVIGGLVMYNTKRRKRGRGRLS